MSTASNVSSAPVPSPAAVASPWRRALRRAAIAVGGAVAAVVLVAGGTYVGIYHDGNVHVLQPGQVVRAAQPSGAKLDEIVKTYGIRSVVNLRGDNTGAPWYDEEIRAARADGLQHYDIALSALRDQSSERVQAALRLIADAPKPVLVHCNGGADRTGLISAAWLLTQGAAPADAERQLSLRYGHFPWLWSRSVAMDRSFAAFVAARAASAGG